MMPVRMVMDGDIVTLDHFSAFDKVRNDPNFRIRGWSGNHTIFWSFPSEKERDRVFSEIEKNLMTKRRNTMFAEIKEYLKRHKDIFLTLAILFLADHFVLNGAIKERLARLVERILGHTEKKINALTDGMGHGKSEAQ